MVEWNIRDLQKRRGVSDATKEMLPKRVPVPKSHPELTTSDVAASASRRWAAAIEEKIEYQRKRPAGPPPGADKEEDILQMALKVIDDVKQIHMAADKCHLQGVIERSSEMIDFCDRIDYALEDLVVYGASSPYYFEPHEHLLSTLRRMANLAVKEARDKVGPCQCACSIDPKRGKNEGRDV